METDRIPEAALFARTYAPSQVPQTVKAWRKDLEAKKKPKLAAAVGDPDDTPEAFEEGWDAALAREREASSAGRGLPKAAPPAPAQALVGLENGFDSLKIGGQTVSPPPPFVNGSVPGAFASLLVIVPIADSRRRQSYHKQTARRVLRIRRRWEERRTRPPW